MTHLPGQMDILGETLTEEDAERLNAAAVKARTPEKVTLFLEGNEVTLPVADVLDGEPRWALTAQSLGEQLRNDYRSLSNLISELALSDLLTLTILLPEGPDGATSVTLDANLRPVEG